MTMPDVSGLPENNDVIYPDDPNNPGRKLHQQHHDTVHGAVKALLPRAEASAFAAKAGAETISGAWNFTTPPTGIGGGSGATVSRADFAWDFMQRLDSDSSSLVLVVVGDSVSTDANEWAGRLADKLAVAYPKFTVRRYIWKLDETGYEIATTVQTGAGGNGRTLDVYIAARAGSGSLYKMDSTANLDLIMPVAPNLVLLAGGHNDGVTSDATLDGFEKTFRERLTRLFSTYPDVYFGQVLLNPKTTASVRYNELFVTWAAAVGIVADLGGGALNLSRSFLDRAGGYADLMADDTHPNLTGSEVLAQEAFVQLTTALKGPASQLPRRAYDEDELFVPALGGFIAAGTPAATVLAGYLTAAGVAFDPATQESWWFSPVLLPWWWRRYTIDLVWTPQASQDATATVWTTKYGYLADNGTTPGAASAGTAVSAPLLSGVTGYPSGNNAGRTHWSTIVGSDTTPATIPVAVHRNGKTSSGQNYPMQFQLTRVAADAGDTYTADALVYGLLLRRKR